MKQSDTKQVPVTVVIPAYNAACYLTQTVESVLAQTWSATEIIVVDDGSTDDTAQIAASLGVRVLSQKNKGLSGARNSGIQAAKTEWVAFIDSDDLWEPTKLEEQWQGILLCPDVGLITTDYCQFSGEDNVELPSFLGRSDQYKRVKKEKLSDSISLIRNPGRNFIKGGYFLIPSSVLVKRDLIISVGMFDEDMKYIEDLECFFRVLKYSPFMIIEKPLMRYRLHENNHSNDRLKMAIGMLSVIDKIRVSRDRYESGCIDYVESLEHGNALMAGRELLGNGEFVMARQMLVRAIRIKINLRGAALLLASYIGPRFFVWALIIKRRVIGES